PESAKVRVNHTRTLSMDTTMPHLHALIAGLILATVARGAHAQTTAPMPSIESFWKIRAPAQPVLASDGTLYVRDWPDGVRQLYRRAPGHEIDAHLEPLTDFEDGISSFALSPDESKIIISAAIGGSEQNDLHLYNTATGELTTLFTNPDVVYTFHIWLRDSTGFIYGANDDSPSDFHIYRYDLATGTSTRLSDRPGHWITADVTDDGTRILLNRYFAAFHAEAMELNTRTGETITITDSDDTAYRWAHAYAPGEQRVLFVSDHPTGVRRLYEFDLATHLHDAPEIGSDAREVESVELNEDRSLLALTFNEDGFGTLHVYRLPDFNEVGITTGEPGLIGDVDLLGDRLTWTLSNARNPGIAYQKGVFTREMPRPITTAETQGIDLGKLTLPELITYTSFDGFEVPAFLYLPPGYDKSQGPIPFVAHFHGGPESQHRPRFDAQTQFLLTRGYGVIKPNVRGSAGYGVEYVNMDNYRNRWDSVKDGVEAARWLVTNGYAERGRIAAYGGSYGGFMAVATVIEGPDIFGASCNVVGIVNFETFLEQTKSYRRALREAEYGPLSDPAFLKSISPINRANDINVPMMIAHGLNDPRVPIGEAMQLAVSLQQRGYDPELLFFPDEGHGFAKLSNRLLFANRFIDFLKNTIGE
ncbi:MAG: S9 family peptidase, partial [Phycisphaerales bacterium]|nr:S9 family peptidase [Phycisphaerales bacterium]